MLIRKEKVSRLEVILEIDFCLGSVIYIVFIMVLIYFYLYKILFRECVSIFVVVLCV